MGTPATPTSDPSSSGHASSNVFRRQSTSRGSMRKMLPPTPDMDTQLHLSAKMIDKRTSTPKGNHSYGPFFLEYSLLAEYNLLQKQKMPGVYVIPSATSPLCKPVPKWKKIPIKVGLTISGWFGVLFIRQGMYQEGIFRFKMNIPENYPDGDCPVIWKRQEIIFPCFEVVSFSASIFWPWSVSSSGLPRNPRARLETDVPQVEKKRESSLANFALHQEDLLQDWCEGSRQPRSGRSVRESTHVSEYSSLHTTFCRFTSNLEEFKNRVKSCVSDWQSRKFSPPPIDDPHYISFAPYEPEKHEPVMKSMIETGKEVGRHPFIKTFSIMKSQCNKIKSQIWKPEHGDERQKINENIKKQKLANNIFPPPSPLFFSSPWSTTGPRGPPFRPCPP